MWGVGHSAQEGGGGSWRLLEVVGLRRRVRVAAGDLGAGGGGGVCGWVRLRTA
jgi:hypothetical protein